MPNYYNTYGYPMNNPYMIAGQSYTTPQMPQSGQYMINVDGEMAARAWQMPANLAPNTIIPLYDLDGQHVYFKSIDSYGRMNPLRKGRIVFDDEQPNLNQGQSGSMEQKDKIDITNYVTKQELDDLKQEIKNYINSHPGQNRSNNRGENK